MTKHDRKASSHTTRKSSSKLKLRDYSPGGVKTYDEAANHPPDQAQRLLTSCKLVSLVSLTSISHWRSNKYSSSPHGPSLVGIADPAVEQLAPSISYDDDFADSGRRTTMGGSQLRGTLQAGAGATIPSSFAEVINVTSVDQDLNKHEMNVGAGGILQERPFLPRASSTVPSVDPADEQGVEAICGPRCFHEDSSTIGSGFKKEKEDDDWGGRRWRTGSDLDEGDEQTRGYAASKQGPSHVLAVEKPCWRIIHPSCRNSKDQLVKLPGATEEKGALERVSDAGIGEFQYAKWVVAVPHYADQDGSAAGVAIDVIGGKVALWSPNIEHPSEPSLSFLAQSTPSEVDSLEVSQRKLLKATLIQLGIQIRGRGEKACMSPPLIAPLLQPHIVPSV
ncbi:uncharacterized protein LACBIDRAFT_329447 [Laccaria bicolor S238N-H82]|uniref:Predicted protein n=1 Tax=Laccaria bicolor (strain S238N-H82 / ATCC MYA-4686) TaxID=486041 RepID=B0DI22_LACBS|nr:uncharacterized protein LACBIDRAFT_329447 [Laccaria bicolor S238N-H82]EDR05832.1 predicted protein [Laccaria bicolor S238N-H82]|eukprot:XP_001883508.1 predicted protein [Laccaria bicolor S238N-H82]